MIPTIQLNTGRRSRLPKTEYFYQAPIASMGGHCFESRRPSFRAISQDYFKNEARQSFVAEAALFCVMVMAAAVPVINSMSALVQLVRAFA